jgi:hypothetical protein
VLLACAGGGDEPQGLSRDRFVAAYVAMVQARIEAEGDSAAYRAARDRALERLGVTPAEMRTFVERGKQEPERLGDAWEAIAARLDTLYGGVTTEPPPAMQRELEVEGEAPDADGEIGRDGPKDGGAEGEIDRENPGQADAGTDDPDHDLEAEGA